MNRRPREAEEGRASTRCLEAGAMAEASGGHEAEDMVEDEEAGDGEEEEEDGVEEDEGEHGAIQEAEGGVHGAIQGEEGALEEAEDTEEVINLNGYFKA